MAPVGNCFVPGCRTGYQSDTKVLKSQGKKVPSLFTCPNDLDLLYKWEKTIPRADKTYTRKDRVCSLHFREEDIMDYYETKMPDGTINKIERGSKRLKPGSVPCIFPNSTKNSPSSTTGKKLSTSRIGTIEKKNKSSKLVPARTDKTYTRKDQVCSLHVRDENNLEYFPEELPDCTLNNIERDTEQLKAGSVLAIFPNSSKSLPSPIIERILPISRIGTIEKRKSLELVPSDDVCTLEVETADHFNFSLLCSSIKDLELPDKMWSAASTKDYIVCAMWNKVFLPEKRIVVESNMNVRVFLKWKEVEGTISKTITSLKDLHNILSLVHIYYEADDK